ncbi:MAG: glycosyltransferase [Candidatus Sericytochromatia bacterium]
MSNIALKKDDKDKLNLSVCILTNNDEDFIEECIKTFHNKVKEIVIVDIGSTDNTISLAQKYTSRTYWHKWNNDYASARNTCLKYASSDWVLYLDAYEKLRPEEFAKITPQMLDKRSKAIAYIFNIRELSYDGEYDIPSCRLFRRLSNIKFKMTMCESAHEDIQQVGRKNNLQIVSTEMNIEKYLERKYPNDVAYHEEQIELAKKGLEDPKSTFLMKTFYKVSLGLSLNSLGDYDSSEEIVNEVIEEIRQHDKMTIYNIPRFINAYLLLGFNYAKKKDYEKGLEILKEGAEAYPNSLNLLLRYGEFLFTTGDYRNCINNLIKMKTLIDDKSYYLMEPLDFEKIERTALKLEKLAHEKYKQQQEGLV